MSRTFGLIPAAGKSRRMGRPKLSLPWGQHTVLEHVVAAVIEGGVESVLVVVGPGDKELAALAHKAKVAVLELPEDTAEMRDTIERGLAWLEQQFRPTMDDGWLLLPADHPCVDAQVVRQLLAMREKTPETSIVVPTFDGHRGHPVWIGWSHIAGIQAMPQGVGLNYYLRQMRDDIFEVPVAASSVLMDLDTPADYDRMKENEEMPFASD
jgi:molybdenum cofactor cytidylyltransferase